MGGREAQVLVVMAILVGNLASAANKVVAKQLTTTAPASLLLRDMGFIVTVLTGLASFYYERGLPMRFSPPAVAAFAYLGLVASFLASGVFLVLLRQHSVTAISYLQFGIATVAATVAILLGGERLTTSLVVGVATVLVGLLLLSKTRAGGLDGMNQDQPAAAPGQSVG